MANTVVALLISFASMLAAQQGGVVEGRVVNSVTHAGVDGAGVLLYTKDTSYEATTDATGGFRISAVKPGEYETMFNKTGFLLPHAEFPARIPAPVRVSDGNDPVRIDIEMAPWSKLAGRVLDGDGKPAAGIEVQTSFAKPVSTDSDGKFEIDGLEPGTYILQAKPTKTDSERIVPLPTYFPSALDPSQAERISVAAGATMSGFEIRLRTAPVYRVRGQVLDQSGKPAPRAAVTLSGLAMTGGCQRFGNYYWDGHAQLIIGGDCPAGPPGAEARTDDDGTFEFPAVSAGNWSIRVDYEGAWDDVRNLPIIQLGSGKVSVSREDIEDLRIGVAALIPLQATVDWGETPAGDVPRKASLMLIPEDGIGFGNKDVVTGLDQAPTLVPAGRALIAAGRPVDGYVLVSVLFGGREALGEVVDIEAAAPPLHLVYKRATNSVRATVDKGPEATILLFRQLAGSDVVVNAYPCHPIGPNGAFEATGLPPGDYYVVAVNHLLPFADANSDGMRRLAQNARIAHIEADSSLQFQLGVTPWPE